MAREWNYCTSGLYKDKFSNENIELFLKYGQLVNEKLFTDYYIGNQLLILIIEGMLQPTRAGLCCQRKSLA